MVIHVTPNQDLVVDIQAFNKHIVVVDAVTGYDNVATWFVYCCCFINDTCWFTVVLSSVLVATLLLLVVSLLLLLVVSA